MILLYIDTVTEGKFSPEQDFLPECMVTNEWIGTELARVSHQNGVIM